MHQTNVFTFIDLFSGIGGFRIALEKHGGRCVFSSEIDKNAQKTYFHNFGDTPQGDITCIDESDIPSHDILCAGFPCQAFSVSGKQRGFEDTRGTLFFDIVRIAKFHKPKVLFLENVPNLLKHDKGNTIEIMLRILDEIGYDVNIEVLNASDYGVPQSRKRLYFVCFLKELNIVNFRFPEKMTVDIVLDDILSKNVNDSKYLITNKSITFKENYSKKRSNSPVRIGTINKGGQGDRIYSAKGHAITLSAEGGGSGAKTGAYLIDNVVRKLTPEECLRVQGFPKCFKFNVSDTQAWKQAGNSVAIPVIIVIFKNIMNTLIFEK